VCLIVNLILPKGLLLSSLYFFANGEIALQYKMPPKKDEILETLSVVNKFGAEKLSGAPGLLGKENHFWE